MSDKQPAKSCITGPFTRRPRKAKDCTITVFGASHAGQAIRISACFDLVRDGHQDLRVSMADLPLFAEEFVRALTRRPVKDMPKVAGVVNSMITELTAMRDFFNLEPAVEAIPEGEL